MSQTFTLEELGFSESLKKEHKQQYPTFGIGRITAEHKERYTVQTESTVLDGEITGHLRYSAESRADFPAVGDFVAIMPFDGLATIHGVLPRKTVLERQAIGKKGEAQIIATNIDTAFIVQAADRDFSLNRLDRYVALCLDAKIEPVILLSKIDLFSADEANAMHAQIKTRFPKLKSLAFHNLDQAANREIEQLIEAKKTYCVLGSSGVGKSTLINNLMGQTVLETAEINETISRGRHTTTHRELFVLPSGGILIDTPGMREIGLTAVSESVDDLFEDIVMLTESCKYNNCSHHNEVGCAVLAALEEGELEQSRWRQYSKLLREAHRFKQSEAERRRSEKELGRMYKEAIAKRKNQRD